LRSLIEKHLSYGKLLIFTTTKKKADLLEYDLRKKGYPARAIHGDKTQNQRDWVLAEFKSGKSPLMIATDVASRGLDVKDIRTVINYDFPPQLEDYIHRVGRTGRAGEKGIAFTFFTENESKMANKLIEILRKTNQHVPPKLEEFAKTVGYSSDKSNKFSRFSRGGFSRNNFNRNTYNKGYSSDRVYDRNEKKY
jgi:ATP-dependent RNA helicase DDX5/DBP2